MQDYRLDVGRDKQGEYFDLNLGETPVEIFRVLQANGPARHLLLHAAGERDGGQRFLCGHDERHWFAATVAGRPTTIIEAKRALLPRELFFAGLSPEVIATRRNAHFIRQGEWFFVRVTDPKLLAKIAGMPIHHAEPLQRGGGKPHVVSECVRFGGQQVILCHGVEYSPTQWSLMLRENDPITKRHHTRMVKEAEVYVRGKVRHRDHATIELPGWCRVLVNGEIGSKNMTFYD